jgi:hypothetical protein
MSVNADGSVTSGTAAATSIAAQNPNLCLLWHRGWLGVHPYIDQAPAYEALDLSSATGSYDRGSFGQSCGGDPFDNGNSSIVSLNLPLFQCPSDPGATHVTTSSLNYRISQRAYDNGHYGAITNYDFSVERHSSGVDQWKSRPKTTRRMFGAHSNSRIRDIRDGSTNSVMLVEGTRDVKNGIANTWGYSKWVGNGIDFAASEGINYWICCPWWATPDTSTDAGRTRNWGAPGSVHTGGLHVALGDASVRFASENIDNSIRLNLAYIADGKTVGEW